MTTSKEENKRIINRDFIGIVLENNDLLSYEEIDIDYPKDLIDQITEIKNDDNCTILDVQKLFFAHYPENKRINGTTIKDYYNYLYPNWYSTAFNSYARYPEPLSGHEHKFKDLWITPTFNNQFGAIEYFVSEKDYYNCITFNRKQYLKKAFLDIYRELLDDIKKTEKPDYNKTIEELDNYIEALINNGTYIIKIPFLKDVVEKECDVAIEQSEKYIKKQLARARMKFANGIIRYIHALHYDLTVKRLPINQSMYSLETIGWFSKKYNASEDTKFEVHLNFGYGSASYFYLMLYYKDVPILPYTDAMQYKYVHWDEFIRYTRQYGCSGETSRELSWRDCLNFTVEANNSIRNDIQSFVTKYIVEAVRCSIDELKSFIQSTDKDIKYRKFKSNSGEWVWNRSENVVYKIYDYERPEFMRIEKATGFLYFLENLRKLSVFLPIISLYIDNLIDINKAIEPKINHNITIIDDDIRSQEEKLLLFENKVKELKKKIKIITNNYQEYFDEFSKLREEDERKEFMRHNKTFQKAFKQKHSLNGELSTWTHKVNNQNELVQGRKKYLERFTNFKNRIDLFLHNKLTITN